MNSESMTKTWLAFLSGLTGFTQREMDVLAVIIDKRILLVNDGIKTPYLEELLFSSSSRKEYCNKLKISDFNLTNLLGSVRKKHAFIKTDAGEDIDEKLIPAEETLVKIIVSND